MPITKHCTGCPKKTHFQNCAAPPNPPASIHILAGWIWIFTRKIRMEAGGLGGRWSSTVLKVRFFGTPCRLFSAHLNWKGCLVEVLATYYKPDSGLWTDPSWENKSFFRAGMMRNKLWGQIIVRVIMSKEMTGVTMESNVVCITRTWSLYSYCHNND